MKKLNVAVIVSFTVLMILVALAFTTTFTWVNGCSMEPTLKSGDSILWSKNFDKNDIEIGVIISYISDGQISNESLVIAHRVISKEKDSSGVYYLTQGDNNELPDPFKVRADQVTGVVIWIYQNFLVV